ncbi:NADase-type glycan-binding domain-containing protein [Streptomyces cadmiisoli]|uniref:NADase-type glycan-binding domain-containing protein n=1 Tax=Streptomyces cadmiisoli TaxID=2184053 RepID=UPI00365FF9FA
MGGGSDGRDFPRHDDTIPLPTVSEEAARVRDAALIAPLPAVTSADDEDLLDDEPDAVLPQAPRPRPARRNRLTARTNVIRPGDLICGDCGQGNSPTRRFCARCGYELREAEVARIPWWRRLRRRRGPRVVALGTVDGQQSEAVPAPGGGFAAFWTQVKIVAGIVFGLSMMLYATWAPFRNTVDEQAAEVRATARGLLESQYSPVRPAKVTAEHSVKGHGTKHLVDLNTATYWSAPYDARAQGGPEKVVVMVEFDRVVRLDQLIVTAGAQDAFTEHGRPRQMMLTFTNEKQMRLQLKDTAKPQKFSLDNATGIKTVRIEVTDVYASEKNKDVSVAELEFFSLLA